MLGARTPDRQRKDQDVPAEYVSQRKGGSRCFDDALASTVQLLTPLTVTITASRFRSHDLNALVAIGLGERQFTEQVTLH